MRELQPGINSERMASTVSSGGHMLYSKQVIDHYEHPRNVGSFKMIIVSNTHQHSAKKYLTFISNKRETPNSLGVVF